MTSFSITHPDGEVPEALSHESSTSLPAHLLTAHGGEQAVADRLRQQLTGRRCSPPADAVTVSAYTTDGMFHAAAGVECDDARCILSHEVRVQRELLTALLEGTSEFVKETTERTLCRLAADGPAAWAQQQESVGRALRGLIDRLEPHAASCPAPAACERPDRPGASGCQRHW